MAQQQNLINTVAVTGAVVGNPWSNKSSKQIFFCCKIDKYIYANAVILECIPFHASWSILEQWRIQRICDAQAWEAF